MHAALFIYMLILFCLETLADFRFPDVNLVYLQATISFLIKQDKKIRIYIYTKADV